MIMDESVVVSSVFFYFDVNPHFSPSNGLEVVKMVHGGLITVYVSDGLESSQLCLYTQWS